MKREMFIRASLCLAALLSSVSLIGCGSEVGVGEAGSDQPAAVAQEELRAQFESIAESGYVGSGLPGLQSGIASLNKVAVTKEFENLAAADTAGLSDRVRVSARKIVRML